MVRYVWRRPFAMLAGVAWVYGWTVYGPVWPSLVVLAVVMGLAAWRLSYPTAFARWVAFPFAARRRRCWYRSNWVDLMVGHSLSRKLGEEKVAVPKLSRIRPGRWVDKLSVRPLVGHTIEDWEAQTEGLMLASGARTCRVAMSSRPGWLRLEFAWGDSLATVVPALPFPERVDLSAVPVGIREDGRPWTIALAGSHVLVCGVTKAGKGSVLWSLLRGISGDIAAGLVEVWAIDPKGGMELGPGRSLFVRFAADDYERMADLLDDAVRVMRERAGRLMLDLVRCHVASVDEPLIVIVVDELANLTAYLPNRKLRERISESLSLLLSQGRAAGVSVVAAVQDPRKDVIPFRNLFPTKIALRLDEAQQVDMVLSDGARRCGARCDRIPESTPGVGFVRVDGVREPTRVRASYVTDADIAAMAEKVGPRLRLVVDDVEVA